MNRRVIKRDLVFSDFEQGGRFGPFSLPDRLSSILLRPHAYHPTIKLLRLHSRPFQAVKVRWPRSTNPSTLRLYCFTPRTPIPPLDSQIPPLDSQIPPFDCQIPSLDDLRFLHSTTSDSFTRQPPNSSTLRLKSSTRRQGRSR